MFGKYDDKLGKIAWSKMLGYQQSLLHVELFSELWTEKYADGSFIIFTNLHSRHVYYVIDISVLINHYNC